MHARLRAHMYSHVHVHRTGFCIAPDTIAYAKVSGADSIAWRTQLHLTPVGKHVMFIGLKKKPRNKANISLKTWPSNVN